MIIINGYLLQPWRLECNYIDKRPSEEPWMNELKSVVELTQTVKCFLHKVCTSLSARKRVSRAHKHVRVLRTKDVARVSIIFLCRGLYSCSASWPHLVSMC